MIAYINDLVRRALKAVADAAIEHVAPPLAPVDVDPVTGPMLMIDVYWQDLAGRPNWPRFMAPQAFTGGESGTYHGAVLKATQGTAYKTGGIEWFKRNWQACRNAAGDRYGHDFVRGAYHYLNLYQDGTRQAEYYLRTIDKAGGWGPGDALPIVDIEFGSSDAQKAVSRAQVIDVASRWVSTVKRETGRDVIMYGGSALSSLKIRDRFGCRWLWPAAYSKAMKAREATNIGWTLDDVIAWQYTDGKVCKAVTTRGAILPRVVPGFGAVDCSVHLAGRTVPDFMHTWTGI